MFESLSSIALVILMFVVGGTDASTPPSLSNAEVRVEERNSSPVGRVLGVASRLAQQGAPSTIFDRSTTLSFAQRVVNGLQRLFGREPTPSPATVDIAASGISPKTVFSIAGPAGSGTAINIWHDATAARISTVRGSQSDITINPDGGQLFVAGDLAVSSILAGMTYEGELWGRSLTLNGQEIGPNTFSVITSRGKELFTIDTINETVTINAPLTVNNIINAHNIVGGGGGEIPLELLAHLQDTNNPHQTTASQVGALPVSGGTVIGNTSFQANLTVTGSTALSNLDVTGMIEAGSSNIAITTAAGNLDADALLLITGDGDGLSSSGSGLEVDADRLGLLQGCSADQLLKWNDVSNVWYCAADIGAAGSSLQAAYDAGNTITTSDARNIAITLANTATDSNFIINIAAGSTGSFQIQDAGTAEFTVTSSQVTIASNIDATAGLDVSGAALTSAAGLTVSGGTVSLPAGQIDNSELANSSITITAGTGLAGGGTVSLGGTVTVDIGTLTGLSAGADTLSVVYGSAANTAVQGNVVLTCPSGTGNLTGGGTSITLGAGGTCAALNTIANPSFTTSVTSPLFRNDGNITIDAVTTAPTNSTITLTNSGTGTLSAVNIAEGELQLAGTTRITSAGAGAFTSVDAGSGTIQTTGTIIGGTINATTALQTGGTTRVDSSGNLVSIGNLTAAAGITISSTGANAITLDSGSNTLVVASSDTTLQRTAAGTYTINLVDSSTTTLAVDNTGSGAANLNLVSGVYQQGGVSGISINCGATEFLQDPTVSGGIVTAGTCAAAGGVSSLQGAYDEGNIITTTDARDIDFVLADTATDSNLDIDIEADNTVSISRLDNAITESPAQLLLLENLDTNLTIANGILFNVATGGVITDAIDVSDAEIVNALNVGANTILGTTAVIDFTNFDVSGAGAVTIAAGQSYTGSGAVTLSSGGTSNLTLNSASNVLIVDSSDTTLQRTASGTFIIDLVDSANTVLFVENSGAGVANLRVSGLVSCDTIDTDASGNLVCGSDAGASAASLQGAYDAGNTITTTNDRNIVFTLSDTTVDSEFIVNLNCTTCSSSGGQFEIRDNGTAIATFDPAGSITFAPTSGQSFTTTIAGAGTLTNTISGTGNAIFDLTSTGDFVIQDNGTTVFTADDQGGFTFTLQSATNPTFTITNNGSSNVIINLAGTGDFVIQDAGTTAFLVDDGGVTQIAMAFQLSGDISPAEITSDQNDYNPTGLSTASTLRLSSDALRQITGLAGGSDGRIITIHNVGSNPIVLVDESISTASSAANRFAIGSSIFLEPNRSVVLQYDATTSRWRVLKDKDFFTPRTHFVVFDDLVGETTTTNGNPFVETNSGTSAGTSQQTVNATNRFGILRHTTGSTATGRAALSLPSTSAIAFGGGTAKFEAAVNITTLSNSTERYQYIVGYADTLTSVNQTDGVYLLYDEGGVSTGSAASANWQCVTASNSTRTFTTSSTAVSAATWVRVRIEVNAAGSSVSFYVDDVNICTHTTNIPTGTARALTAGSMIIKSAGTTARTVDVDYIHLQHVFTTPR